jgi:membrane protease YdiL (CAAX protease family)
MNRYKSIACTSIGSFIRRQPFFCLVILAYGFSWSCWLLSFWLSDNGPAATALFYLAGFGPWIAAMVILKAQGRSLRGWLRSLFKWRLHPGWYGFALGFPVLLVVIVSLIYWRLGNALDFTVLPSRLGAYVPTLLLIAIVQGGNEEPGWRGFGLPVLQQRHSPFVATGILGLVWAFWHVPLLVTNPDVASGVIGFGQILFIATVTLISIATHAFWYTWLMNRTGSVFLCILLHASYNAANGLLVLVPDDALQGNSYQTLLALMTGVLIISVVSLLVKTQGQLGASRGKAVSPLIF